MSPRTVPFEFEMDRATALASVAKAAELWGAEWQPDGYGGRLLLPVTAGVRRGVMKCRLTLEGAGSGHSRGHLVVEEEHHWLNRPAVMILVLGAAGALAATLWPFFPKLLAVAPLAVVLALVAWLVVVSRLTTSGPAEFLELVEDIDPAADLSSMNGARELLPGDEGEGNGERHGPGDNNAVRPS